MTRTLARCIKLILQSMIRANNLLYLQFQQNIQHLAMFGWMKFSLDTWRLAGAQSLFIVKIYNMESSQLGTVVLSAQVVRTITRSPALVVDLLQLETMDHALLHLPFKLLFVEEIHLGTLAILYQWCSKVAKLNYAYSGTPLFQTPLE